MKPTRAEYRDLGLIDYEQAWELQRSLFDVGYYTSGARFRN